MNTESKNRQSEQELRIRTLIFDVMNDVKGNRKTQLESNSPAEFVTMQYEKIGKLCFEEGQAQEQNRVIEIIDKWKRNTFIHTKFHCVGCNKKLIESKNTHNGYHLCICKDCRLKYFKVMTEEIRNRTYKLAKSSKELRNKGLVEEKTKTKKNPIIEFLKDPASSLSQKSRDAGAM